MKAKELIKEIRAASDSELVEKISAAERELMNLRFQHTTGQLTKTSELGAAKTKVARMKTVLKERKQEKRA